MRCNQIRQWVLGSTRRPVFAMIGWLLITAFAIPDPSDGQEPAPLRILLTNDDGIEKVRSRVYPMAQRLRAFAEVYIVVSDQDRSGSTHFMSINRKNTLEARLRYTSPAEDGLHRLEIYTVNGFPADCVALAVLGILADRPPDLVISGPNGGANLGDEWFGSGTIGAARTAAYLGIPALAVSGLDDDYPDQVDALARWLAALAQSEVVRSMPHLTYFTVGVPRLPPAEIAGIRVAPRARLVDAISFQRLGEVGDEDEPATVWAIHHGEPSTPPPPDSDVALHARNFVVVTPMRADEHDTVLLETLGRDLGRFPAWPAP